MKKVVCSVLIMFIFFSEFTVCFGATNEVVLSNDVEVNEKKSTEENVDNKKVVENETEITFPFAEKEILDKVADAVLLKEGCPYEAQVNLLITDNEGIRTYNASYRQIDRATDVLSFPNLDFETPADFSHLEEHEADYFDPESGELLLGDIILSADKVKEQAESYGHSELREFAFLFAHSMLHLHITREER